MRAACTRNSRVVRTCHGVHSLHVLTRRACCRATVRDASEFGVQVPDDCGVDFAAAMTRMRRLRADMAHHDSAARFQELGIDVFLGSGSFTKDGHVEVAGKKLNYNER